MVISDYTRVTRLRSVIVNTRLGLLEVKVSVVDAYKKELWKKEECLSVSWKSLV